MSKTALWHVEKDKPHKLRESGLGLEKQLEAWIEDNPSMLRGGLTIAGRQFRTKGGPIDLLALDPVGRWIIIELKAGTLRRETITQALDYAACIKKMPSEELYSKVKEYFSSRKLPMPDIYQEDQADESGREVMMMVVGKGSDAGFDRMVELLAKDGKVPISVVSYEVFELGNGERILLRELTDADNETAVNLKTKYSPSLNNLCLQADKNGVGKQFRALLNAAKRHGLYPRTYRSSVMYTPPNNKARMLFTVWVDPKYDGKVRTYVSPPVFAEFYSISEKIALAELGPIKPYRDMTNKDVQIFIDGLDNLFKKIENDPISE
jgi:hypothetical protein